METPNPRNSAPLCDNCGERPGSVRLVFATEGGNRAGALCDVCAREFFAAAAAAQPGAPQAAGETPSGTPALDEFGRDLTADAAAGRIDPVIGRADEIEQTVEILARRRKNNAVLIGEAGVGKTAIAEGLALRIATGDVPETLREARVVALDLAGMLAGSQYRGQFEQRMKSALAEVVAAEGRVVLFVDELHTVLGAGSAEGAMDAANILKPMLARGELRMVGATTLAEYREIERDSALARRFSPVSVEEPTVEETVAILRGLRDAYQEHHGVEIDDEALEAAARLSDRYVTEYRLPDKAIDLVDQASRAREAARRERRGHAAAQAPGCDACREAGRGRRRGLRGRRAHQDRDRAARGAARRAGRGTRVVPGRRDRDRGRDRRAHRDPGGRADRGRARAPAGARDRPARAGRRPGRGGRASSPTRSAAPASGSRRPTGRWGRSCSSARPASARPSS